MFKRIISMLLAVIMVCSGLLSTPFYAQAEETTSGVDSQTQAQADNALAGVLADAINEEQEEQQVNIYRIGNVVFDGWTASVRFAAPDNAKLVVAVFDEESNEMLTSAQTTVDSTMMQTELLLPETEIPEYYIVKAFLLDSNDLPLSESYIDTSHTKRMAEFYATTTADFDAERVINADASAVNNFAVVSDGAILIESSVNKNFVTRNDYDEGVFVFENADSTVKNLKPGDVIYVPIADYILVKVGSVKVNGNTVTVNAADTAQTGELFSFIKIDTSGNAGSATGRVGDNYADDESGKGNQGFTESWPFSASISDSNSSDIIKPLPGFASASLSYSLSLNLKISATGNFTYSYDCRWGEDDYVSKYDMEIKASGSFTMSASGSIGFGIDLLSSVPIPTPIAGLEIYIDADMKLTISVELSTTGEINISQKEGYHKERNSEKNVTIDEKIKEEPKVELKLSSKIEGKIKFEISVEMGLRLLRVIRLYAKVAATCVINLKILEASVSNDSYGVSFPWLPWAEDEKPELLKHDCTVCLIADIKSELTIGVGIKISFKKETDTGEEKPKDDPAQQTSWLDLLKFDIGPSVTIPFEEKKSRISVYNNTLEFEDMEGSEECPHIRYLATLMFIAANNNYNLPMGVNVTIEPTEKQLLTNQPSYKLPTENLTTDAYGKVQAYLPTGTYSYQISANFYEFDATTTVERAFDVNKDAAAVIAYLRQLTEVTVFVKDTAGNPVPNAVVDAGVAPGTTNSQGITSMRLPIGACSLKAKVDGYVGTLDTEIKEDTLSVTVIVDMGQIVTVNVVNEHGKPLKGAMVKGVATDADGKADIVLPKGTHEVYATFNYISGFSDITVGDDPVEATIAIPVGTKITFISQDADGKRLPYADIDGRVRTDSNGTAYLWLKDGSYTFRVNDQGRVISKSFTVAGEELTIVFTLQYPPTEITFTKTEVDNGYKITFSGYGVLRGYHLREADTFYLDKNYDIREVVVGSGIVAIDEKAFANCYALQSVSLPSTVEVIGNSAFYACGSLQSITIPSSVKTIETSVFYNCVSLQSVVLPSGLTSIQKQAFYNCEALHSITIPANVIFIGESAFDECDSLKKIYWNAVNAPDFARTAYEPFKNAGKDANGMEVIFGDQVEYIPANMFYNCLYLTKATIGNGVKSIGKYAFYNCERLQEVTMTDSVTQLGSNIFTNCIQLKKVRLSESLTELSYGLFSSCSALENITLPTKLTKINGAAFNACKSLVSLTLPGSITSIEGSAFAVCSALTQITIPDGTVIIKEDAFNGCSGLTSVTLPSGEFELGDEVFSYCTALTAITIPENLIAVGDEIFKGCSSLQTVYWNAPAAATNGCPLDGTGESAVGLELVIGDNVESLPESMFWGSGYLKKVTFGSGMTQIPANLFNYCKRLEIVSFSNTVTEIGESAFLNCPKLNHLVFPDSLVTIGEYAFENCTGLTDVDFGNGVQRIGASAFRGCTGLTELSFPDSLTEIKEYAFMDCTGLLKVKLNDGLLYIRSSVFYDCGSLSEINLPDSLAYIGDSAFYGCAVLTQITIPENVIYVGRAVLEGCLALETICWNAVSTNSDTRFSLIGNAGKNVDEMQIIIGDMVACIPAYAFSGCSAKTVTIGSGVRNIGAYAFSSTDLENVYWNAVHAQTPENARLFYYVGNDQDGMEIVFGDEVEYIPADLFVSNKLLRSVTIGKNVKEIGERALGGNVLINTLYWNAVAAQDVWNAFYAYAGGIDGHAMNVIFGDEVEYIPEALFYENETIQTITIPDNIKAIGELAFSDCYSLQTVYWNANSMQDFTENTGVFQSSGDTENGMEVIFGENVESVPAYAFCMSNLSKVQIGNNISHIREGAFYGCTKLSELSLADGIENIDDYAFYYCMQLPELTIPDSVTSLGSYAFFACSKLQNVTIPGNITSIPDYAFSYSSGLQGVTIAEGVTSIGRNAFSNCQSLQSVSLPDSINSIGQSAFYDCSALKSLTIPDSVEIFKDPFGYYAEKYIKIRATGTVQNFSGWSLSTSSGITVLIDSNDKIDSMAIKKLDLLSAYFKGISKIPASALKYCNNIRTVTIDSTVTEIGSAAFYGTNITTVNFLGTEEQWNNIVIGANNEVLQSATINFNVQADAVTALAVAAADTPADNGTAAPAQTAEPVYRTGAQPATRQDTPDSITLTNAVEGMNYVMFILKDAQAEDPLSAANLLYIDQQIAIGSELTFHFVLNEKDTQYTILFSGAFVYVPDCDTAGHAFGDWIVIAEPSCLGDGMQRSTCAKCLLMKEETIEPNGHSDILTAYGYEADCWDDGLTDEYTCSVCGFVTPQTVIPAGHAYGDWVITEPTDTTDGIYERTCDECGETQTQFVRCEPILSMGGSVPVVLHENEITYLRFTPTESGTFTIVSVDSNEDTYGYVMDANKNILAENDDGDNGFDFALTFNFESGKEYYIAVRAYKNIDAIATVRMECSHAQTTPVDAKAPTCGEDGNTAGAQCVVCQQLLSCEILPATGNHTWDDGVVTTEPTTTTEGVMTYTCTVCSETKSTLIDKLQNTFTESEDAILTASGNICTMVGKTAENLLAQAGTGATLVNNKGETIAADEKVGTGAVLTLADGTQHEIIVLGDTNGDGEIASSDARFALRYSVGLEIVAADSVYVLAADSDASADISSADARLILRASVGLESPEEWFEKVK